MATRKPTKKAVTKTAKKVNLNAIDPALLKVAYESASSEEISGSHAGVQNTAHLRNLLDGLDVHQKISLPNRYRGTIMNIRKEKNFENRSFKTIRSNTEGFIKVVRIY